MQKRRELFLTAVRPRDDGRVIANEIAEFLTLYAHQVVYLCSVLPPEQFEAASFNGLLVKRCIEPKIAAYISLAKKSLARWVSYQRLTQLSVVLFDEESVPKERVAEFQVRFFQPLVMPIPKMYEFEQFFTTLRKQLRAVLLGLHSAGNINQMDFVGKVLTLKIYCTLVDKTTVINRAEEHAWRAPEQMPEFNCTPILEPTNENVSCELAQLRFFNLIDGKANLREDCQRGIEVEYSMLSEELSDDAM